MTRTMTAWYSRNYSRLLIDNHITDHRPEYMSRFSPEEYARLVKLSGVESSMVYACDHNGNCYFPTKVGHQHANLHGRDIFGETIALLRQANITPIAYYTVTYNNDCARRLPQTAVRSCTGVNHSGRYHFTCPNQPDALAFYQAEIAEVLQYDIDGIFIDMTFWPLVCCCDACRDKFGRDIPQTIDWRNPEWIAFQRFRETSMAEFAHKLTDFVRSVRPGITVTHQFSPVLHGWFLGQSTGIATASDYASGDFYGSKLQQRFGTKVFDAFSSNPPFEFMTSRCVTLYDHTSSKSDDELLLSALTTLANGGAYFFIDAINPDGTLEESFYQRLGQLNKRLAPFRETIESLKPRLVSQVGIYFSMECCVNQDANGTPLAKLDSESSSNMSIRRNSVCEEVMGTADLLTKLHIPYIIITERQEDYSDLKVIFISQATYLSSKECHKLSRFVQNGGIIIATGETSLYDETGHTTGDFTLADALGVHFTGNHSPEVTYTGRELISASGKVPLVTTSADTEVLAFLTFPDFPVGDETHYASIHSNPPAVAHCEVGENASAPLYPAVSPYPAVTLHTHGNGQCLWLAAPLLRIRQHSQQEYLKRLLSPFLPIFMESENLPASAEVTLLKATTNDQYIICIVNYQDELPPIPLHNVKLHLRLPCAPSRIRDVATGQDMPFSQCDDITIIPIPCTTEATFIQIIPR